MKQETITYYYEILRHYTIDRDEESLVKASDLGRELIRAEIPPEDLSEMHQEAIIRLSEEMPDLTLVDVAFDVTAPFVEMLMSYSMAFRRQLDQKRKTEQTLAKLEDQHKLILSSAGEGIIGLDKQEKITFVNPAATKQLKCEAEELTGKAFGGVIQQFDENKTVIPFDREKVAEPSTEKKVNKFNNRIYWRSDKVNFPVEYTSSPIRENAQVVGVVITFRDISERVAAEEKQKQLLSEIAEINEELDEFAYVVSHDLKAPLRAIASLSEWISMDYADSFDEDGKEQMKLLLGRVQRMSSLIDGVLQYSRIGRRREAFEKVDLNNLLVEIIDNLAPPENIEVRIESALPKILCEKVRIGQVFQNLLSNALKFTGKLEGEVCIGCTDEGNRWRFYVSDNGVGIEEKHFEKVFQIFQTLSPRDKTENTGVGLSIVKKVVEMYGGEVSVKSEVGVGTTFFFTIPKKEQSH